MARLFPSKGNTILFYISRVSPPRWPCGRSPSCCYLSLKMRSPPCFAPDPQLSISTIRARRKRMREPTTPTAPKRSRRPSAAAATSAPKAADDSDFISSLDLWQASRKAFRANTPDASAGTRRPFTFENVLLAWQILTLSLHGVQHLVFPRFGDRARDVFVLIVVYVVRGLLPASRAFSHARILDEVCLRSPAVPQSTDFPSAAETPRHYRL